MTVSPYNCPSCGHTAPDRAQVACGVRGCPTQAATRLEALTLLPEAVPAAMEDAAGALAGIPCIEDTPFGAIAVTAVYGFVAGLPRGWALVDAEGRPVDRQSLLLGLEGWGADLEGERGDFLEKSPAEVEPA